MLPVLKGKICSLAGYLMGVSFSVHPSSWPQHLSILFITANIIVTGTIRTYSLMLLNYHFISGIQWRSAKSWLSVWIWVVAFIVVAKLYNEDQYMFYFLGRLGAVKSSDSIVENTGNAILSFEDQPQIGRWGSLMMGVRVLFECFAGNHFSPVQGDSRSSARKLQHRRTIVEVEWGDNDKPKLVNWRV